MVQKVAFLAAANRGLQARRFTKALLGTCASFVLVAFSPACADPSPDPRGIGPIDTYAAYYLTSDLLNGWVNPDFKGGTLRVNTSYVDNNFTVETYPGNTIDSYGHIVTFSGVLSGEGGLIIAGTNVENMGGGKVIFTGDNTYTGGTAINSGATLQIGNGEAAGSIVGDVTNNGALVFNRSDAVIYGGAISGTGSLTQVGSGTLILINENTYTGGTTISAGTLQIGYREASGSVTGDITNNAALVFNRSDAVTYAGKISGTGSLTQTGVGTLILTGANTYTGDTTVSAGTLQIGNGGTSGSVTGNIVNNGTLAFNRSNTLSYNGTISGTGSVNVNSGTVVLTGSSTYTGLTTIASGSTLQIGNGGTTGSITGDVVNHGALVFNHSDTVIFNGNVTGDGSLVQDGTGKLIVTTNYDGIAITKCGKLQIGNGSSSGTVTGNIVNNTTVVFGQTATTTYNGVISGSGGVSVSGGGVVILNGSNTYTGPTTVTAGSLIIGDVWHPGSAVLGTVSVSGPAIIGGYGMIGGNLVASGGVVSPGNSIGTLTVNGNYTQSASSTLKIEVSPTASDKLVVGGTAQLGGTLSVSAAPGNYATRSVAIVTAGSISGTFATVNYTGAADGMVYGLVYAPKEVDLTMAPKTSGQIYGDLVTESLDTAVVLNRATLEGATSATGQGWTVWSRPLAGASLTRNNNTGADFNSQIWGVISGIDYGFGDGTKLTGAFSYTHSLVSVHGESDKAYADGYFFAAAGHIPVQAFSIDLTGFVQHNVIDITRSAAGAKGHTTNLVGGGSVQVGYPLQGGAVLPFARLTVASLDGDSFNETQASGLAFGVSDVSRTTVRGMLGVEAHQTYTTADGMQLVPRITLGLEEEFGDRDRALGMSFAGTAFVSPAATPTPLSGIVGAGLTAKMNDRLDVHVGVNGRVSSNQREGLLDLGVRYAF